MGRRGMRTTSTIALFVAAASLAAACSSAGDDGAAAAAGASAGAVRDVAASSSTTAAPTTTTEAPTTTTTAAPVPPPPPPPPPRSVHQTGWTAFATVGGVTLVHPSNLVERVGFHESNHDGARDMEPLPTAAAPVTLESRERGTGARTAADVVADPDTEIRAPVSGVVKRAGRYTLYCDHTDNFVVIEPAEHPGWEVKLLHIDGLSVRAGQRVTAGVTVLASRPRLLPFESQVDELASTPPAWPHVHIEVVDPTIKDRPSPGGGCT